LEAWAAMFAQAWFAAKSKNGSLPRPMAGVQERAR
jgi:hypothetical protein